MKDPMTSGYIDEMLRDAQQERQRREQRWSKNKKLYEGAHADVYGVTGKGLQFYTPVNRIQGAVQAQVAIQTETQPKPIYSGVETNEPPEVYLSAQGADKVQLLSDEETGGYQFTPEELSGEVPLPEAVYRQLASLSTPQDVARNPEVVKIEAEIAEMQMGKAEGATPKEVSMTETVQVPMFDDSDFVMVTDELAAQALTEEIGRQWAITNGDEVLLHNITEKAILGEKDTLIQWDTEKQTATLENLYNYDVWYDRLAHGSYNARKVLIRCVYDIEEAKKLYPDYHEVIEKSKNNLDRSYSNAGTNDRYTRDRERDLVAVWHYWEKDYPFPMDVERAVAEGFVEQQEFELIDEETGEPVVQAVFVLPDGSMTDPEDESWPTYTGLRQVTLIGDEILYDDESEFADIPVARNINLPRVESPYGIGDPEILEPLQKLYNKLWAIQQEYYFWNRQPNLAMPKSVYDEMREAMKSVFSAGNISIGIPNKTIQEFGNADIRSLVTTLSPPQLSQAINVLMDQISAEMDRIGGTVDALRGEIRSDTSGRAISNAITAARGPIGYKAKFTAHYLRHIAKIMAQLTIDFLPEDQWSIRSKKFPPQVISAIKRRLKTFGYDIKVEIGGVSDRARRLDAMIQMLQNIPAAAASPTLIGRMAEDLGITDAERIAQEISGAAVQLNQTA